MKRLLSVFALLLSLGSLSALAADTCTTITPQTDFFALTSNGQISFSGQSCTDDKSTQTTWTGVLTYNKFTPAQVARLTLNGSDNLVLTINLQTLQVSANYNGSLKATYGQTFDVLLNNVTFPLVVDSATGKFVASDASGTFTINGITSPATKDLFALLL